MKYDIFCHREKKFPPCYRPGKSPQGSSDPEMALKCSSNIISMQPDMRKRNYYPRTEFKDFKCQHFVAA